MQPASPNSIPAQRLRRNASTAGGIGEFSKEAVEAQMEKILGSSTFLRSKRLGRFLRFTVEQFLDGQQGSLKEYLVGVEVFNKPENFDPRIDSIVRVEARRLRSKLERYYATDGREDEIVIDFRKGSYVPAILSKEEMHSLDLALGSPRAGSRTIAVARFTNLGVDSSHSHFSNGLSEDLLSALTKIPGLRVIAQQSSASPGAGGPNYIVEGSVRQQGERFRIAIQLIDTTHSTYIWSETYERDVSDVFSVQEDVSRSIAHSLRHQIQS